MDCYRRSVIMAYYFSMSQAYLLSKKSRKRKSGKIKSGERKSRRVGEISENEGEQIDRGASNLLSEMLLPDHESFYNNVQMTRKQFEMLLHMVGPSLTKNSIRKPVSEQDRLLVTLRFLATGMNYTSLAATFAIGKSTTCKIIKETTEVIWSVLNEKYIPKPTTEQLRQNARQFWIKTGMPNCIGAIDRMQCVIQAPGHRGMLKCNYKKAVSIALMAVCDTDYNYMYVNIDAYGPTSEGGILGRTEFGKDLLNNRLELPVAEVLPYSNTKFPYYIVGDKAFPLKRHLMRPYGGRSISADQEKFNSCLSTAQRTVESTFRIMVSTFRIYHSTICANPDLAASIVRCTAVLHNFIRKTKSLTDPSANNDFQDVDLGRWRNCGVALGSNNPSHEAIALRNVLKDYLNGVQTSLKKENKN